jgi:hypothetical protein
VILGSKYLFHPTHLVGMSLGSGKPPIIVMPIFPRASGPNAATQMWQPLNSQAGLWRLLIELAQFFEREGYAGPAFGTRRFNGAVAPTAGNAPPPPPAFSSNNRPRLGIRDIIISGYSSGSVPLFAIFKSSAISGSTAEFAPALFGADPAEFDKRWKEYWALDLFLNEGQTGIQRTAYQNVLRSWLTRDSRRMRLYHGGWTLEGAMPDAFFPVLRKQLSASPWLVKDGTLPSRWSADWRDPAAHWSALFFSGPALRARFVQNDIVPSFPLGMPDGSKGDPPAVIHPFTMQIGFGHALSLR